MVHSSIVLENLQAKYRLWRWRRLKRAVGALEGDLRVGFEDFRFLDQDDLAAFQGKQELLTRYRRQIQQLERKERIARVQA